MGLPDDALNAICPYWTMFPLEFPLDALAKASGTDWVLDPFCGRGTTLFAARKLGLSSVGIDSNIVAVAIAQAKLASPRPDAVIDLATQLVEQINAEVPSGRFWELAYHPEVLRQLASLREGLLSSSGSVAAALRGVLLGALHGPVLKGRASYLSNQMPRTYSTKPKAAVAFWEREGLVARNVDVLGVVRRHAERRYGRSPAAAPGAVWHGDAAEVLPRMRRRFAWVVTSPPYPGMVTYRPDGWLRGWFLGGKPSPDYDRAAQLGGETGARFVRSLARVWSATARRCTPNARLIVRFGALPSRAAGAPEDLLLASLELSGDWRIESISDAGVPPGNGARQADQLGAAGDHVPEVDVYAVRRGTCV